MYYCEKCKKEVIVTHKGEVTKLCKCSAPVVADMSAIVYSHSKLNN